MPLDFRLNLGYEIYRSYREFLDTARAAEDFGFTGIVRGDHLLSVDDTDTPVTEAWTCLAAVAAATKTLRLGTLVSPVTFRNPGLLARTAATLHEISDGRAEVGLGAGWYDREHLAFGFPIVPWPERFDWLEEQLHVVRGLLTGEHVTFEGPHTRIDGTLGAYPGHETPPAIIVGGNGKPRTIRLAAQYSDELNLDQILDVAAVKAAFERLDVDLAAAGRDTASVIRSNVVPWPGDDFEAAADAYAAMEAAGVQRLYLKRPAAVPIARIGDFARRFIA
jgi:alkanesulfonate monooxygenase SsuD/methylene tetrahydromethanopterin reductase-like flavin-dependent oxidoreductase (luciferase family)